MTICSSVIEVVFLRFGSLTRWIFKGRKTKLVYQLAACLGFQTPLCPSFDGTLQEEQLVFMQFLAELHSVCSTHGSTEVRHTVPSWSPDPILKSVHSLHSHGTLLKSFSKLIKIWMLHFQSRMLNKILFLSIGYLRQDVIYPGWPWIRYGWRWSLILLQSAVITSMSHCSQFVRCWGSKPELSVHGAGPLPTEPFLTGTYSAQILAKYDS